MDDANLQSLKISPGNLSPKFETDTTEYTASVGSGVEKVRSHRLCQKFMSPLRRITLHFLKRAESTTNRMYCYSGPGIRCFKWRISKTRFITRAAESACIFLESRTNLFTLNFQWIPEANLIISFHENDQRISDVSIWLFALKSERCKMNES